MRRFLFHLCTSGVLLLALLPAAASAGQNLKKAFWVRDVSDFPTLSDLDVNLAQIALNWNGVALTKPTNPTDPNDPAYQWPENLDSVLAEADKYNMDVLLMLQHSPRWANGGKSFAWVPKKPTDFADFAVAASKRYSSVRYWLIWGEASRLTNFRPIKIPKDRDSNLSPAEAKAPQYYARLLDTTYAALKKTDRADLVVGGNTYSPGDVATPGWIKSMRLPNGRPPRMDLYGHNPFGFRGPDLSKPVSKEGARDFSDLARLYREVKRSFMRSGRNKGIKLFLSEWTIPTDSADAEFNYYVDRPVQAQWIKQGFKIARSKPWIHGLGWIHLNDGPPEYKVGGLIDYQGNKKPGYYAFKRG